MAGQLPPELRGRYFAPTAEQAQRGWSQNWPEHWRAHDALLAGGGHPPTAEQAERGHSQNWDAWKSKPDCDGVISLDFTGGPAVRAAKEQASKETEAWEQQQLKGTAARLCLLSTLALPLTLPPSQSCATPLPAAWRRPSLRRTSRPCCSRRR